MLFLTKIIFRNILFRRYAALLSILLIAFSTTTVFFSNQIARESEEHLINHAKGLHFVVGAKGSPLQLVLASVFHFDNPAGNISFAKADSIAKSPFVETAIPISLGDNYGGFRIVGTDNNFFSFYALTCKFGDFFSEEMHAVVGAAAAEKLGLTLGSKFRGLHGLVEEAEGHEHDFVVTGILNEKNSVLDNLILTPLESYWHVHAHHEEAHEEDADKKDNREITALLVRAKGTTGALMMPNMINKNTDLLAASPASEVTKLKSLISGGTELLYYFSLGIVFIALVSILFSFLSGFGERKFDLALLRISGARTFEIVFIVVGEAFLICFAGIFTAIMTHQLVIFAVYEHTKKVLPMRLQYFSYKIEDVNFCLFLTTIAVLASVFPAASAARANLPEILKKN